MLLGQDATSQDYSAIPERLQNVTASPLGFANTPDLRILNDSPALGIGYTDTTPRLRAGYTGLVLPGACISSYFVYSLRGVILNGSLPVHLSRGLSGKITGEYLFAPNTEADQEITWVHLPPGVRHWTWARSSAWRLQGEFAYAMNPCWSLLAGLRWETVITRFGSPIPDYPFTVADMESGLSLNLYQPFIGLKASQELGGGRVLLRIIGLPAMVGSLEHFNTCNNAGVPFAHVGSSGIKSGYFLQAYGELSITKMNGWETSAFLTWDLYRGTCPMKLERRDAGPPVTMTSATVDFSYDRSSLTLGAKLAVPF
ncbi:MAG: hypothetical protein QG577_2096 [Thermodesulfobacteriota bacterium]|nr:hypothetical protein [Thermodesulfobacteriota bacterium]